MSIQQIQTKNLLELIAQSFMVNGYNPLSSQISGHLAQYFAKYPAGFPIQMPKDIFIEDFIADEDKFNDFLASLVVNFDTLFEACQSHIDQMMLISTLVRTHLERLRIKRKVLEGRIDDYLLSIYNSDGYFYSISDSFSDTSLTDFTFTNAYIDTISGVVSLPSVSTMSQRINPTKLTEPTVRVVDSSGSQLSWNKKTDWVNCLDGMTNTAWYFEVRKATPGSVNADLDVQLSTSFGDTLVTKIDLIPFGTTPVQVGINAVMLDANGENYDQPFSHYIRTSSDKMSFIGDQIIDNIETIKLQLTKAEPDYYETEDNTRYGVYIFGFKEIMMTEQYYDPLATFVSVPHTLPSEFGNQSVIDAVSIVADHYIPTNTSARYYIAENNTSATNISDFNWREVQPLSDSENDKGDNVIRFDGAFTFSNIIRQTPRATNDIKMIELNTTSTDLSKRSPTPAYIPGVDVYRIVGFSDSFLSGTLKLEEGFNSTRIYYTELDPAALTEGFSFWKNKFDNPTTYSTTYGTIDSGHEFFYGADVGEGGKSIYVETYLHTDHEYPVFIKECRKSDQNSKTWGMKIYLNGREIANMPVGVNTLTIPWKLKEGANHIAAIINIPETSIAVPSSYIGTINLMADSNLYDFGTVKLADWTYVDLYKLQNNQVNNPNSFTIYNNEIISRKKPTDNFRLTYKKETSNSPQAIRVRIDMDRSSQYAKSTPIVDSYRLRFAYS